MTWPALLLASALLASPGWASSPLTPECCGLGPAFWCQDLATARLCDAEQLCQALAWAGLQDNLLPPKRGIWLRLWDL
ncbi:granulysin [Dasypus novemcinctus]|uniref:granulysin n=1 Tax=Dasypus novemcinctus TaxID=9361 RepID=UPI0039C9BE11